MGNQKPQNKTKNGSLGDLASKSSIAEGERKPRDSQKAFRSTAGESDSTNLGCTLLGFEVTREKKYRLLFHNGSL